MRKVTFMIDDIASMKEIYKNELSGEKFDDTMKDQKPFRVIFSVIGNKSPDRYELSDMEGNRLNINDLNGYQRACIMGDCYKYFENKSNYYFKTDRPFGVVDITECEI